MQHHCSIIHYGIIIYDHANTFSNGQQTISVFAVRSRVRRRKCNVIRNAYADAYSELMTS